MTTNTDESVSGLAIWCPWCEEYIAPHTSDGVAEANLHAENHMDVAPTAPEVEETYVLAPAFEDGDRVQDVDQHPRERGTAVIIGRVDGTARDIEIETLDSSVAELNPGHPAAAPVYRVAFEGWLDANVDSWEDMLDDDDAPQFATQVKGFCEKWRLEYRTYDYPATRLTPRQTCPECGERLEWVESVEGYICPNSKYIHPDPTCDQDGGPPIAAIVEYGGTYDPHTHGDPETLAAPISMLGTGACPVCDGEGEIDARPRPFPCPNCGGSGLRGDT